MLKYKLLETREDSFLYEYYPEGKIDSAGLVSVGKTQHVIKKSPEDEHGYYANMALRNIEAGNSLGTVAWY